jgi:hypothetical protein
MNPNHMYEAKVIVLNIQANVYIRERKRTHRINMVKGHLPCSHASCYSKYCTSSSCYQKMLLVTMNA